MLTIMQTAWLVLLLNPAQVSPSQYVLEVPGDASLNSTAIRSEDGLVVTDAEGEQFVYVRKPQFDTQEFRAYYTPKAGRYLRWPIRDTGGLQVGAVEGRTIVWSPSRMRVRRLTIPQENPSQSGPALGNPQRHLPISPLPFLSVTADRRQTVTVAIVDQQGTLQTFQGQNGRWSQQTPKIAASLLPPHTPLEIRSRPGSALPTVYTLSSQGEFLEIRDLRSPRLLAGLEEIEFIPGSQFDVVTDGRTTTLFAVDSTGRLWELDAARGEHQLIESRTGLYEPGTPVKAADAGANQIMLIDRRGNLVAYNRDPVPGWRGPMLLDTGYTSGGELAAWQSGQPGGRDVTWVAASDRRGRLRLLREDGNNWDHETIGEFQLPPGSSLATYGTVEGSTLFGVLADGRWVAISQQLGVWDAAILGTDFPPGAPVAFEPRTQSAFVADANGRVVGATLTTEGWQAFLLAPDETGLTPRLVRRHEIVNRGLAPIEVQLANTHSEELLVSVIDSRFPARSEPQRIPPGKSITLRVDRDLGRTIEETYLVPGPGGVLVEQTQQLVFPPQGYYEIAVAAQRVTYAYIDRRKKPGPLEDFTETTPVSLGAFLLPPGELLQNGTVIDVYQEALRSRNPGAPSF